MTGFAKRLKLYRVDLYLSGVAALSLYRQGIALEDISEATGLSLSMLEEIVASPLARLEKARYAKRQSPSGG